MEGLLDMGFPVRVITGVSEGIKKSLMGFLIWGFRYISFGGRSIISLISQMGLAISNVFTTKTFKWENHQEKHRNISTHPKPSSFRKHSRQEGLLSPKQTHLTFRLLFFTYNVLSGYLCQLPSLRKQKQQREIKL